MPGKPPLMIYKALYDNPGWPVIFEDVGAILSRCTSRPHSFRLMQQYSCRRGVTSLRSMAMRI